MARVLDAGRCARRWRARALAGQGGYRVRAQVARGTGDWQGWEVPPPYLFWVITFFAFPAPAAGRPHSFFGYLFVSFPAPISSPWKSSFFL